MKLAIFLVFVLLLTPLWLPMLLVRMSWDLAKAVDLALSEWISL